MILYYVKFVRTSLLLIANVMLSYTLQRIFTAFFNFLETWLCCLCNPWNCRIQLARVSMTTEL
jgi:hypothetical protein